VELGKKKIMSAEYRPVRDIPFRTIDERLERYGIKLEYCGAVTELIGPFGILFAKPEGNSTHFERHLGVDTDAVLDALQREYGIEIVNEDDHRFWGFATMDEMNASFKKVAIARSRSEELCGIHWILVEGPCSGDAEFTYRWLQSAIEADRLLQHHFHEDPGFRSSVSRLEIACNIEFATSAMAFIRMWLERGDTFSFDLIDSEWAEIGFVMAAVGFFSQTGDRYQMTIPKHLTLNRIKEVLLQLANTEDADSVLHPEHHLATTTREEAQEWKKRLSAMPRQQRVADRDALLAE
jgi:hypothetical protein